MKFGAEVGYWKIGAKLTLYSTFKFKLEIPEHVEVEF